MTFEALSIVYPAATKIARKEKVLEIRSWRPPRVPLLNLVMVENHRRLERDGDADPEGLAVAIVDIVGVRDWTEEDAQRDGNTFAPGYFAWVIANVRPIAVPFRVPAERLIYRITGPETIAAVVEADPSAGSE
jgi:hypothetical protein